MIILQLGKLDDLINKNKEESECKLVLNFLMGYSYSRLQTLHGSIQRVMGSILNNNKDNNNNMLMFTYLKYYNHFNSVNYKLPLYSSPNSLIDPYVQ
jgi:hypothetical protein